MRRWPKEADAGVNDALPAGKPVPGLPAYRTMPGRGFKFVSAKLSVADLKLETKFEDNAKGAVFTTDLPVGKTQLKGLFQTADGEDVGAFYVYVERLEAE